MNRQEAIGFLGKDARITRVSDDRFAIQLRVGVTQTMMKRGQRTDHSEWFDVKLYCSPKARDVHLERGLKGAMVFFAGSTFTEDYQDEHGETRYRRWVICDSSRDVEYLREPRARTSARSERARAQPSHQDDEMPPHSHYDYPPVDDEREERPPPPRRDVRPTQSERAPVARSTPPVVSSPGAPLRTHADLMSFD